jgi:hypothetical protein
VNETSIFLTTYTIIDNKVTIIRSKPIIEHVNYALHKFLTTKDSHISDFI